MSTFIVVFGGVAYLAYQAIKIDIKRLVRYERKRVQTIIDWENNSEIIGDVPYINPPAEYPKRSALIRDMEEPRGV
jgi:hypothetical protein